MKKDIKYIGVLLTEYFTYPAIYLSAVLFLLLCALGPVANINDSSYSVLELITNREYMSLAAEEFECCSYNIMLNFSSSPWFSLGASVIAAIPALAVFIQNSENTRRQILIRMNKRAYSTGLFWSAFLTGVLIALVGILLYAVIAYAAFPPISSFGENAEFITAVYGSASARLLRLIKKIINCCIICGIFPLVTLIVYQLLHDRFLAMTIPMMIQYVSLKASIMFGTWRYSDPSLFSNDRLNFLDILFPSSCMIHYYYWEQTLRLPFACFFIMSGVIIIALYLVFDRLNRRSIGEGL